MRIGVIHWAFLPFIGGVETHLAAVYPEIAKSQKVFLLTGTHKDAPDNERYNGMDICRVPEMVADSIKRCQKSRRVTEARRIFTQFLDENNVDIVHAHNLHLNFLEYSSVLVELCKDRNIPCVLIIHNDYFQLNDASITKKIMEDVGWDKIVCISKYLMNSSLSSYNIERSKYEVIMHGIDLEGFNVKNGGLKEKFGFKGKYVIFMSAKIIPKKGALQAVKAMKYVVKEFPGAILLFKRFGRYITGKKETDTYIAKVDLEIKKLGLRDNIASIDRYLTTNELAEYYAMADIVINPSVYVEEPFGLVPVEAMATGTPVVVTRSGGLVESVIDGKTGFIITKTPSKIPNELGERIIRLLGDPDLRKEMGEKGKEHVTKNFDKKRMANDLISLSRSLLS